MTERTHYDTLGLVPEADGTAINRAYWLLARKYQAEAGTDPRAHLMLDELNEAYAVLGTPAYREAYDAGLARPHEPAVRRDDPDGELPDVRARRALRAAAALETTERSRRSYGQLAPYVGAGALGATSLGAGLTTGNLVLTALGAIAALATGLFAVRGKLAASVAGHRVTRGTGGPAPETSAWSPPGAMPRVSRTPGRHSQADELRLSTASMVGRWRAVATTSKGDPAADRIPDSTLVDIFRSEQEIDAPSEPLLAALEVLKGSRG